MIGFSLNFVRLILQVGFWVVQIPFLGITLTPLRVFHTSVSRWSSTGVWVRYYLLLESVFHQRQWMVIHWGLSDSKSPQVSRTLHSILAVLSNILVWMISCHPLISKSSRPFNNPLVTVPKALITIGIIVPFKFHSFFSSLARTRYLSFFSLAFKFILWSARTAKSTILQVLFYLFFFLRAIIFTFGLKCLGKVSKKVKCSWCNGYRRRKWTRRHEFKSWTRLIAFHTALIRLGKVWIQLFSLQLWVNSRTD